MKICVSCREQVKPGTLPGTVNTFFHLIDGEIGRLSTIARDVRDEETSKGRKPAATPSGQDRKPTPGGRQARTRRISAKPGKRVR
jgi:hypothetical protein